MTILHEQNMLNIFSENCVEWKSLKKMKFLHKACGLLMKSLYSVHP
jgi:hypothetical protein